VPVSILVAFWLKERDVAVRFLDNPAMNLDTAHGELLLPSWRRQPSSSD
jgi:hypothetical protein